MGAATAATPIACWSTTNPGQDPTLKLIDLGDTWVNITKGAIEIYNKTFFGKYGKLTKDEVGAELLSCVEGVGEDISGAAAAAAADKHALLDVDEGQQYGLKDPECDSGLPGLMSGHGYQQDGGSYGIDDEYDEFNEYD